MTRNINMAVNNATLYRAKITDLSIEKIMKQIQDTNKIGLGKDSIKFEAKPSITSYDYAGKGDNDVKDFEEITGWSAKLTGDVLDLNEKLFNMSLMELQTDTNNKFKRYAPKEVLDGSEYEDVLAVGTIKGTEDPIVIVVRNCFNEDGCTLEFKDKDNASASLTFVGKKDIKNNSKAFEIIIPTITSVAK